MKIGALIENGPMDWQIIQQVNGKADISLGGRWMPVEEHIESKVFVRVVREDNSATVIPWRMCEEIVDHKWTTIIDNVPTGGLYRIETCLSQIGNKEIEWSIRGDMIHHVGVGDVYVIAGQSNSAGYAKDTIYDPPEFGIHLLKNSGKWDLATHPMNESTNIVNEITREPSNPGHSPYLSFARRLKTELGYPIGLIQTSLGGSPIRAWNPDEDGALYGNMMRIIKSQVNRVKGILWYQGCSDAVDGFSDTYYKSFKSMVSHIRHDLMDEKLPILTVQLNRWTAPATEVSNRSWGKVREGQRQAAKQIENVFIVPSTDCALSDCIHNSSSANLIIGERLAGIALKRVYGTNMGNEAPDLIEARKVDTDRISLTFNNIYSRLYTFEVGAGDLGITFEDEAGFINIRNYEIMSQNSLMITLDRIVKGRCQVHGAFEQNPKPFVPIDFASHIPMLSFYGEQVME